MMPAMMPACSWSLPSVGDTFSTLTCFELHRQRAVLDELGEVVGLVLVKSPEMIAVPPNDVEGRLPGRIAGADCTTPSSTIATCSGGTAAAPSGVELACCPSSVRSILTTSALARLELASWRCSTSLAGERRLARGVARRGFAAGLVGQHDARVALVVGAASWSGCSVSVLTRGVVARRDRGLRRRRRSARRRGGRCVVAPGAVGGRGGRGRLLLSPRPTAPARAPAGSAARRSCRRARRPCRGPSRRGGRRRCRCPGGVISGSATPRPSTRLRMMSTATSSGVGLELADRREHDRDAALEVEAEHRLVVARRSVARKVPTTRTSVTTRKMTLPAHGSVVARAVVGGGARRARGGPFDRVGDLPRSRRGRP